MSNIWFTSDTHFCHNRGFLYEPRNFTSIEEMNEAVVKNWNDKVQPGDTVYHLGDVMLNDNEKGMELLSRLNGNIHLIIGNHDTANRLKLYQTLPNLTIEGYATLITYRKYHFYLSHHPTLTSNLDNMAPISQHTLNLFGHTHQKTKFYRDIPFMYHVGLDSNNCSPVEIETIISDINLKAHEGLNQL